MFQEVVINRVLGKNWGRYGITVVTRREALWNAVARDRFRFGRTRYHPNLYFSSFRVYERAGQFNRKLYDTVHSPKSKAVASDRTPKRFAPNDDCDSKRSTPIRWFVEAKSAPQFFPKTINMLFYFKKNILIANLLLRRLGCAKF